MTFDEYMVTKGYTWSMEVLDKAVMTLIDQGDVVSYFVRYTFIDAQQTKQVIECYTWCPEITAASFLVTSDARETKDLHFDESKVIMSLDALREGEKLGTATTDPKESPVSTKGK